MMQAALAAALAAAPPAAGLGQQRARAAGDRSALTRRGEWGCRELARRALEGAVGGRLRGGHGSTLQGDAKKSTYSNARARMGVEKEGQPGRPSTLRMRVGRRADTGEDDQWSTQKPLGRLERAEACPGAPLQRAVCCHRGGVHAGLIKSLSSPEQRNASWNACTTGAADWYRLVTQSLPQRLLPLTVMPPTTQSRALWRRLALPPSADVST